MRRAWIIAYDIADDARRRHVAALLQAYGRPLQWSVYCCENMTGERRESLRRLLGEVIDIAADSVRWYPLCSWCRDESLSLGDGAGLIDSGYIVI